MVDVGGMGSAKALSGRIMLALSHGEVPRSQLNIPEVVKGQLGRAAGPAGEFGPRLYVSGGT